MKTLLFDTETTGLVGAAQLAPEHQPYITEFYGHIVTFDGLEWTTHNELEFMCNPGIIIPDLITKITGITTEMVRGKPRFAHYASTLQAFFNEADCIVAHNLAFDKAMLEIEGKRNEYPFVLPPIEICTIEATEFLNGFRLNLSELHKQMFGEPFEGAHRAKQDVHALTRCFAKMKTMELV